MDFWRLLVWAAAPLRPEGTGFLKSFAARWSASPQAVAIVPFDRFVTGRIPAAGEVSPPYISMTVTGGRFLYRSDKTETFSRIVRLSIYVDGDQLETGEEVAEIARRIYHSQSWSYNFGRVTDVIPIGPPMAKQVPEGTFQAWELTKLLSVRIEQRRVDSQTECYAPAGSSGSAGSIAGSELPSSSEFQFPASSSATPSEVGTSS